jgi:hypothetical protein
MDFFTVPTLTGRVLFVVIVLSHVRRRIVHFNITEHPKAEWTAQQVVEAFPDDTAARWLHRDRDRCTARASAGEWRVWAWPKLCQPRRVPGRIRTRSASSAQSVANAWIT